VERVPAETEWAGRFGYSRAVRRGSVIEVAGTTAAGSEGIETMDAGEQARVAMRRVVEAIEALGGSAADVVRTRMFVVDIAASSEAVGLAHGEIFGEAAPSASMLGVAALIAPELLVEVEATAIVN
jgi:enamine deaminase RidA (YjgF/YER057c/UK114 family)